MESLFIIQHADRQFVKNGRGAADNIQMSIGLRGQSCPDKLLPFFLPYQKYMLICLIAFFFFD